MGEEQGGQTLRDGFVHSIGGRGTPAAVTITLRGGSVITFRLAAHAVFEVAAVNGDLVEVNVEPIGETAAGEAAAPTGTVLDFSAFRDRKGRQ